MRNALMVIALCAGTFLAPAMSLAAEIDTRIARVSYVSGEVSYQRGDDDEWSDLRVNTPLMTGDALYAPQGGRAEIDLGNGIVVRVDGGAQVELVNSSRNVAQLGVTGGVVDLSARSFPPGFTLEVDTPQGAATILEPGRYRVDAGDRVASYSVVQGSLSLALDAQQLDVREGESLEIQDNDPPTYGYGRLPARTQFDGWADERDARWERSVSARYVNNEVVGYEDLDDHGSWRETREYGRVWMPAGLRPGWAPYQVGRWIWQDPYGWTWVSYEPWGWAPYHYGRWVFTANSWCWVPPPPIGYRGPSVVMSIQPVYAPALVAFVGGRNWGVSLSIGGPAIGWVPLAPRETYYYPWQPAPRVVVNNYTNITVINAVTVVNYNNFATETVRPVHVDSAQITRAPVIGSTPVGVVPARASLVVSAEKRPAPAAIPPSRTTERPLVARLVPPPKPQPFSQKVAEIERTGRPVPQPVAVESAVGKPFVPGVRPPAGVKPFSSPAAANRKELNARPGAEVRAPKKIERDIAPPVPVAPNVRRERPRTTGAAPGPNAPVPPPSATSPATTPPAPAPAAPAPASPGAPPVPKDRQGEPTHPPGTPRTRPDVGSPPDQRNPPDAVPREGTPRPPNSVAPTATPVPQPPAGTPPAASPAPPPVHGSRPVPPERTPPDQHPPAPDTQSERPVASPAPPPVHGNRPVPTERTPPAPAPEPPGERSVAPPAASPAPPPVHGNRPVPTERKPPASPPGTPPSAVPVAPPHASPVPPPEGNRPAPPEPKPAQPQAQQQPGSPSGQTTPGAPPNTPPKKQKPKGKTPPPSPSPSPSPG